MPEESSSPATTSTQRTGRGPLIIGISVLVVLVIAVVALVWWALASRSGDAASAGTEPYRAGWESAMKKAGVTATLPPDPTPITSYKGSGSHQFDATFTPEEATALLNVYTLVADVDGQAASITGAKVGFPEPGVLELTGNVSLGDQTASARIKGAVTYTLVERLRAPSGADVSLEGFTLSGANATRATEAAVRLGNEYLIKAPKLTVVEAEIVDGGVKVKGQAPNKLEYVGQ